MSPSGSNALRPDVRPDPPPARRPSGLGRRLVVVAATIAVLALAACASASAPDRAGHGTDEAVGMPVAATAGPAASAAPPAAGGDTEIGRATSPDLQDVTSNDTFIVRTGSMTVEVPTIDPALLRARTAITGLGGYVSSSDQTNDGDRTVASVTYRFPSARWEDAQAAIRDIATKVVSAKTDSAEVTGQVLDLGARITNLRATETALQAIMVKATKIPDILAVQDQLTTVQGQIEELSTEEAHLRDQASLATLSVLFQTPAVAVVNTVSEGWDVGAQLDQAAGQLLALGQAVATAAIWLVVVGLPVFLGALVLLLVLAFVGRRIARRIAPGLARTTRPPEPSGPGA